MSEEKQLGNIRRVILTFIITSIVVTTLVSGASAQLGLLSAPEFLGGEEDISAIQSVPNGSNYVARVDVQGLIQDDTTDDIINSSSEEFIDSETPIKDILQKSTLDAIPNNTTNNTNVTEVNLDPEDVGETLVFGKIGIKESLTDNKYRAAIVEIDSEPEEVMKIFYGVESEKESRIKGQKTLKGPNDEKVTVIDDGLYIVGSEEAIRDSIDTALGEKEPVDDSFVPKIQGDTHLHIIMYGIGDFFGTFDAGELGDVPDNASLTYTTTDRNTAIVSLATDMDSNSELNQMNYSSQDRIDRYEDINIDREIFTEGGEVRFEVNPDDVEETNNELQSLISPDTEDIFNPPER